MKVTNFKLGIGFVITWSHVPTDFFLSTLQMERPDFSLFVEMCGALDDLRNNIVQKAQAAHCTHLIMMDTDQVYLPETIPRLLSHKRQIVGAAVHRRYPPFDPILYRGELNKYRNLIPPADFTWGDLVEVDATGTGCLCFDMRIFDVVPYPWFKFTPNPNTELGGTVGEDIWFCYQCRRQGSRSLSILQSPQRI